MNTPAVAMVVVRPALLPVCLADVEVPSGWSCHIDQMADGIYNVLVLGAYPHAGIELRAWTSLAAIRETLGTYFNGRGLRHTFVALWASVEAELRS